MFIDRTHYLNDLLNELNDPNVQNDFCQRASLCREALSLFSRDDEPNLWANLKDDLGRSIRRCSLTKSAADKQESIAAHRSSLEILTREAYPSAWASAMTGLGLALLEPLENRVENTELAIEVFRSALEVRTYDADKQGWANTTQNLVLALIQRFKGRKSENLSQAITLCRQILACRDLMEADPDLCNNVTQLLAKLEWELKALIDVEKDHSSMIERQRTNVGIQVLSVFDLLRMGKFEVWKNCTRRKCPSSSGIPILVSHRWETLNDPDPTGLQFQGVVRFAIQACMMAMGSTPNVFNNVDASEVIVNHQLFAQLRLLYQEYTREVAEGPENLARRLFDDLRQLLAYLDNTIGRVNSRLIANDLMALTYMMRRIEIWYDYTCLPQHDYTCLPRKERSRDEEEFFQIQLDQLGNYFRNYFSLIIWSSDDIKRAWCLMEAIVGWKSRLQSIFCCKNSLLSSNNPSPIYQLFFSVNRSILGDQSIEYADLNEQYRKSQKEKEAMERAILQSFNRELKPRVDLSNDLTNLLTSTLTTVMGELNGLAVSQVHEYLVSNKYLCTDDVDYGNIATAIVSGM